MARTLDQIDKAAQNDAGALRGVTGARCAGVWPTLALRVRRIAYMATGKPYTCVVLWSFPLAKAASTNGAGAGQPPTIAAAA